MSLLLDSLTADNSQSSLLAEGLHKPVEPRRKKLKNEHLAVIGLGYVGLPLAVSLAEHFEHVTGLDISTKRVRQLQSGVDSTNEISPLRLAESGLSVTASAEDISNATFYIVTVPTPITAANQPDLSPLTAACQTIGRFLKPNDMVVFESTVYPGVTEDICGKILSDISGLEPGKGFFLGYSPERINPGDKINTIENIAKIVAGDCTASLERMEAVYGSVIKAGLHKSPSIKVAEGAKVLENTQRDVNIALMNELALICDKVGINTHDVIAAAATKWNFVPFTPGLVGGHCIGVDPYYLASLAEQVGLHPQVILSGRRLNDGMVGHVGQSALRMLIEGGGDVRDARIGVFGLSFKEDVPDLRNSKAVELVHNLRRCGLSPLVHDPICHGAAVAASQISLTPLHEMDQLDLMIVTVPHTAYRTDPGFLSLLKPGGGLMDVRSAFRDRKEVGDLRYWTL